MKLKRILCALLTGLLLLSAAACAESNDDPADTGSADTSASSEGETKESLDIPDTRYDGETLTFLTRDANEWSTFDIYTEDVHSDNISEAVYTRNEILRDRYGVTVAEIKTNDTVGRTTTEVSAGTGDFQAVISTCGVGCTLSSTGHIWNLMDESPSTYLSFDKSWWDSSLISNMSINSRLYFATGDLLTSDNDGTFSVMFNKKLAVDCQLPDMYEMVGNMQWTFDKLYELEQLCKIDKDGDGKLTFDEDVFGFAYTSDVLRCMIYAGNVRVITKDEDDLPFYNLDVERCQNIADKCQTIFGKDFSVNMSDCATAGMPLAEVGKVCFGEGHALFCGECLQCVTRLRSYDVDFGILPFPMYDEEQNHYYSTMNVVGGVVSIPRTIDANMPMVASMIEAMACLSQDTLTQQYYEINLKTKNAKDEQSGPMIDMILANRLYDLAYHYGWGSVVDSIASSLNQAKSASVASRNKSLQKATEKNMNTTIKNMDKAAAKS